jgi:hypothetical protein
MLPRAGSMNGDHAEREDTMTKQLFLALAILTIASAAIAGTTCVTRCNPITHTCTTTCS